jgi:hypothetical protein
MSHYTVPDIVHLPETSKELTLQTLLQAAKRDLDCNDVVIEFSRDVLHKFVCPSCGSEEERFAPLGTVRFQEAHCPKDGHLRTVVSIHSFSGQESFGDRRLDQLGLPLFDLYLARTSEREIGYVPYGDAASVLGPLAPEEREL